MQWEAQEISNDKTDKMEKSVRYIHYLYNYMPSLCFKVDYPSERDWRKNNYFITLSDNFCHKLQIRGFFFLSSIKFVQVWNVFHSV